jgi:hypothetical protein
MIQDIRRQKKGIQRERAWQKHQEKACNCWLHRAIVSLLEANSMCLPVTRLIWDSQGDWEKTDFSVPA